MVSDDDEPSTSESTVLVSKEGEESGMIGKLTCSGCGYTVENIQELRLHYKHDWHRYNVKRKLHGQDPVTDAQFYDMMG